MNIQPATWVGAGGEQPGRTYGDVDSTHALEKELRHAYYSASREEGGGGGGGGSYG